MGKSGWKCKCGKRHTLKLVYRYVHPCEELVHTCGCGKKTTIKEGRIKNGN